MNEPTTTRKRPAGVWIISSFCIIIAVRSLLTFDLAGSSVIPTPAGQPDIIIEITALDHFFTIIGIGITIAAAITLFLLKKAAFYLFAVSLGLSIVVIVQALTTDWGIDFDAIFNFNFDAALIFVAVSMLLVELVPLLYSWRLKQKGVLR